MATIGILGGTFDPIHYAHLYMGELAADELKLDKVIYLPNGTPPHKARVQMAPRVRYEMTCIATTDNPRFEVSDYEISQQQYCYTVDTVAHFKDLYKDSRLIFIIGEDSLSYIDEWKESERLLKSCEFAVIGRGGFHSNIEQKISQLEAGYGAVLHYLKAPELDLSSALIRQRLREGKSVRYLMPPRLIEYIEKHGVYR